MKNWMDKKGTCRLLEILFGLLHIIGFFLFPHLKLGTLGSIYSAAGAPKYITGLQLLILEDSVDFGNFSVFGVILLSGVVLGLAVLLMNLFGKGKLSYAMTIVISVVHHVIYIPALLLASAFALASMGTYHLGFASGVLIAVSLAEFITAIVGLVTDGKEEPAVGPASNEPGRSGQKEGMLIGVRGAYKGYRFPICDGETIMIGRDPQFCQIVLEDKGTSRKHCAVRYNAADHNYSIVDYSSNGVYDQEGARLQPGIMDIMQIGEEFRIGASADVFQFG